MGRRARPVLAAIWGRALHLVGPDRRRAADAARDRRDWVAAAALYQAYLDDRPDGGALWVQLGHARKESGDLEGAEAAYVRSLSLRETADGFLQLGHVLKLRRQADAAVRAYARSYELEPTSSNPAFGELMAAEADSDVIAPLNEEVLASDGTRCLYLDLTDLVAYLRVNASLSGIQRVVANLLIHAPAFAHAADVKIVPVLPAYSGDILRSIDAETVLHLLDVIERRAERTAIDTALVALLRSRRILRPNPGDTFIIAGAFWIYRRYDLLNAMRRRGVQVAVFIHDLIQITNPAYVEPMATEVFRRSFVDVLDTTSFVLTNSAFVASEVRRFLGERMTFDLPVQPVTLATELGVVAETGRPFPREIGALATVEYVLVVGTIEIRKNHIYVVRLWERLLAAMGDAAPHLIFVGKWGWEIEELRDELKRSGKLKDKLLIFNGIPDDQLAFLYRHCLFTIYPSFAEGWGLPVGESLAYGKPCVASNATAIPEVGGDLCRYIDPFDLESGYALVRQILSDRADLTRWAARVRREFQPKSWQQFSLEFYAAIVRLAGQAQSLSPRNNVVIPAGKPVFFGDSAVAEAYATGQPLLNARMSRGRGWRDLDHWGCWAAEHCAWLSINTALPQHSDVTVFLLICGPNPETATLCDVQVSGGATVAARAMTVSTWTSAAGRVGADNTLTIRIRSAPLIVMSSSKHDHLIGLVAVGYVPAGDPLAQMAFAASVVPLDPAPALIGAAAADHEQPSQPSPAGRSSP